MPEAADPGLRERKKRRTRAALVDAALRLFAERGYDRTTVADIAAEADVSPRTFFAYFRTKDDVLFVDTDDRIATFRTVLAQAAPGDRPIDVLRRACEQILAAGLLDVDHGPVAAKLSLMMNHPGLQASALRRALAAERALTDGLRAEFPDVDPREHAALVGAALGALITVALRAAADGTPPDQLAHDLTHALDLLDRGFGT